jgi:hypothetical protein
VLEVLEASAAAFDLFDEEVESFGWPVAGLGVVVGEDLGAPSLEGLAEGADLADGVGEAARDRLVQQHFGIGWVVGVAIASALPQQLHRPSGQPA